MANFIFLYLYHIDDLEEIYVNFRQREGLERTTGTNWYDSCIPVWDNILAFFHPVWGGFVK